MKEKTSFFFSIIVRVVICIHFICIMIVATVFAETNPVKVKVGIFSNNPLSFFDGQGVPQGIYPDVIREVAKLEKWDVRYIQDSWSGCLERLEADEIDLMISIVYSKQRDLIFDFSKEAVVTSWGQVYTHKGSDIKSIVDLDGRNVSIMKNDINAKHFKNLCNKFNIKPNFNYAGIYDDVCQAVLSKQADAAVINNINGTTLLKKYNIQPTPIMFSPVSAVFASPQGKNKIMLDAIDEHLSRWRKKKDSVYYTILNNWYGNKKGYFQQYYRTVIVVSGILGAIALFFFIWMNVLRIQVKIQTKKLRESEVKHRKLISNISDVIVVLDQKGVIRYKSPNITKQFGWAPDELTGKHALCTVHPDDQERVGGELSKFLKNVNASASIEFNYLCKDGSVRPVELTAVNLVDDPVIKGVLANYKNITDRKNARNELKESERNYRSIIESMDDAAYICSPEYRIRYMNPAMKKMIGYDATGEVCYQTIFGFKKKCPKCFYGKVQQGNIVKTEIINQKNKRTYHTSNSPIRHPDGSVSMLSVFRDITEIRQMEGRIRQAQKMEAIGTLAGGIAHDFNNILFPISGYAEILLEDVPENSPLRDSINEIYSGTMRAKELVKQILTFSRQDSIELAIIKIQHVIKEALKLIRSTIPTTIEIKQDIDNSCAPVKADHTQIHQIIMNLATNAYHAMQEKGGKLKVTLKEIELSDSDLMYPGMKKGIYNCLTVADTGVGMEKELLGKIFDPYFTTKEKGKGTGMGLSVVHGIISGVGGAIKVYSEPGQGTEFRVYFRAEKKSFEAPPQTGLSIQGGNEHILLVDDEEGIIALEKKALKRLGYKVSSRVSSVEALEAFRVAPEKYDIVISDVAMPNLSGDRFALKILDIRPEIPIILCTGFSETITEKKATELGIKGFLMKPIIMKELAQTIRNVLNK